MCRLFASRSLVPARVHPWLVESVNSLQHQSHAHPNGWGIAHYDEDGWPKIASGLYAAHRDPEFERASAQVCARTVIAHVRLASVGAVEPRNLHPFRLGKWLFAHNGTLRGFARRAQRIEAEVAPHFRSRIRGTTDSERCFQLFLTLLERSGGLVAPSEDAVAAALARTVNFVTSVTDGADGRRSSANFLVSDGELLIATRRGRELQLGGTLAEPARGWVDGASVTAFRLASEPLSTLEPWHEVPEETLVGVSRRFELRTWKLSDFKGSGGSR